MILHLVRVYEVKVQLKTVSTLASSTDQYNQINKMKQSTLRIWLSHISGGSSCAVGWMLAKADVLLNFIPKFSLCGDPIPVHNIKESINRWQWSGNLLQKMTLELKCWCRLTLWFLEAKQPKKCISNLIYLCKGGEYWCLCLKSLY